MIKDHLSSELAVILHADISGSTELVQQDKLLAHERFQDAFLRFSGVIEKYQGRVVELRGDALLAVFERASDAVSAAITFQSDQSHFLSELKDNIRPTVRVGIAMGEVVVADSTLTGAGVVQSQRVEQLADAGGVCITAAIREALSKSMPFELEDLGEQLLKGFDLPMRVYRVGLSADGIVPPPQISHKSERVSNRKAWWVVVVFALVIAGGSAYWFKTRVPAEEVASIERMAFPLPDKPSIAVLPFTNMSNDDEQEFFADGMTEDLITDISKLSGLFVIARNSVFTYKGKAVKVRQVAEELGVRYVMEGSVRRVGNQVRINAQLIDATTGGHLWAERYDGSLNDVFALQDRVVGKIVSALAVNLTPAEQAQQVKVETKSPEAHDAFLKGWSHYRRDSVEDLVMAIKFLTLAVEIDPAYSRAHAALASTYWRSVWRGWTARIGISTGLARHRSRTHLEAAMLDPSALAHQIAAERKVILIRNADKALKEADLAIGLDPNDPAGYLARAQALLKANRPSDALISMRLAIRLDPHYPAAYLRRLARAHFALMDYEAAREALEDAADREPDNEWTFVYLAATYGQLGMVDSAKTAVEKANRLRADVLRDPLTLPSNYRWPWLGDDRLLREGLAIAGVKKINGDWLSLISGDGKSWQVEGVETIDAEKAKALHDQAVAFIYIGNQYRPDLGHIPGSNPLRGMGGILNEFHKARLSNIVGLDQPLVIYSSFTVEKNAANASALARSWGFQQVYYFEGGALAWKDAGYPIEKVIWE